MFFCLRYIFGCVSQDQLAAFYRDARVGLITPLRDGMNLVAKEFAACQPEQDPGVLILSPFAGAGGYMQEALQVNPYEVENVADTLNRALEMPLDERQLRMNQLKKREKKMDVDSWVQTFLQTMGAIYNDTVNNSREEIWGYMKSFLFRMDTNTPSSTSRRWVWRTLSRISESLWTPAPSWGSSLTLTELSPF